MFYALGNSLDDHCVEDPEEIELSGDEDIVEEAEISLVNKDLFIYSFIYLFIHSFIYSFIQSFIHSFRQLFIHSVIYSLIELPIYSINY